MLTPPPDDAPRGPLRPAPKGRTTPARVSFLGWIGVPIKTLGGLLCLLCALALGAEPPAKPISVATNVGNPPYEYLDEKGQPTGFNNDLIRALERATGRPLDLRPMPFGTAREAFERGTLDALGTVIYTEERAKVMDFTVPTHTMTYILLVRTGDRTINSERDLIGRTVVVNRRNAVAEHFKALGIPYQELDTNEACILALRDGKADCAVAPKYTWLYFKTQNRHEGISMLSTEIYPSRRGIAIHKGNPELLAQLNEGIFRLKEDGTLDQLYAKHFGALEASEVPFSKILRRVMVAALPIMAIILLAALGLWSWALRRVVRRRTVELRDELTRRSRLEVERECALAELTLYKAHLEELVTQRSTELKEANLDLTLAKEAAESANQMKSAFLANMSHEIRTPMNAVTVLTHLALQTDLTDKQRQYLLKSKVAADSLLGIINDILDFSKIEAGKLQMDAKDFFLEEEFEKITQLVGMKTAEKHLEFLLHIAPNVPPCLHGDPMRLGQVLTNLCSNSVKFTESGEVVVTVTQIQTGEGRVTLKFSVRDTGIGMSPDQTRLLFQPFSQVDSSSTRKFTGTGLGLAISKHLVSLMGGELWVESELGRGSEFFFTAIFGLGHLLPAPRDSQAQDLSGLRILIVDDSPIARLILHGLANGLGYPTAMVASAKEAMVELQRGPYDLVILDWHLREEDGFEAARRIRSEPSAHAIPKIIMVTAYGDEEVARRVEEEGLDGYLTKPISPSSLFDAITRAFGRNSTSGRLAPFKTVVAPEDLDRLKGARILLVEDNDFNQQVAMELLALMGMDVTLAEDGREAIEKVHAASFDAVLMDLQMPVMDGYEATRLLRSEPRFASLPILAMTAHAMLPERERCLALGMNDYVTKPIIPDELFGTLANWIRRNDHALEPPTHSADRQAPPGLPTPVGLSRAAGLATFSGNVDLYEKMLRRFLELKPNAALEIKSALADNDVESAARLAHSMIAVAGTIGAMTLSALARDLQYAIPSGVSEAVAPLLARFETELSVVVAAVQAQVDPTQETPNVS